ncbi:MAG: hypothetical protein AAGH67_06650 [Cyanobacteria bacterium P01_H01_bin.162]
MWILLAALALGGCSVSADSAAVLGAEVVPPMFAEVYAQVERDSNIPMLLPTSIPEIVLREQQPDQSQPFFVSTDVIDVDRYEVNLDAMAGCEGAGYCIFGIMGAERIMPGTPSVDEQYAYYLDPEYQPVQRSDEPIAEVQLANGLTGTFIPWVCGANCSTAKVYWQQEGIRYYIGIRGPIDQATVVEIANSMIENQPAAVDASDVEEPHETAD